MTILKTILPLIGLLSITSCEDNTTSPETNQDSPIGTWSIEGINEGLNKPFKSQLIFEDGGQFTLQMIVDQNIITKGMGEWVQSDSTIYFSYTDCFKANQDNILLPNDCDEDYSHPDINRLLWNGTEIYFLNSTTAFTKE